MGRHPQHHHYQQQLLLAIDHHRHHHWSASQIHVEQAVGGRPPRYAPAPVRATRCGPAPAHTRLACGAQRALLPVAVGAMNIHDVRDKHQTDVRRQTASLLNAPAYGAGA